MSKIDIRNNEDGTYYLCVYYKSHSETNLSITWSEVIQILGTIK